MGKILVALALWAIVIAGTVLGGAHLWYLVRFVTELLRVEYVPELLRGGDNGEAHSHAVHDLGAGGNADGAGPNQP